MADHLLGWSRQPRRRRWVGSAINRRYLLWWLHNVSQEQLPTEKYGKTALSDETMLTYWLKQIFNWTFLIDVQQFNVFRGVQAVEVVVVHIVPETDHRFRSCIHRVQDHIFSMISVYKIWWNILNILQVDSTEIRGNIFGPEALSSGGYQIFIQITKAKIFGKYLKYFIKEKANSSDEILGRACSECKTPTKRRQWTYNG